jgi:hypothetical protein
MRGKDKDRGTWKTNQIGGMEWRMQCQICIQGITTLEIRWKISKTIHMTNWGKIEKLILKWGQTWSCKDILKETLMQMIREVVQGSIIQMWGWIMVINWCRRRYKPMTSPIE